MTWSQRLPEFQSDKGEEEGRLTRSKRGNTFQDSGDVVPTVPTVIAALADEGNDLLRNTSEILRINPGIENPRDG
jgi:hypothetical protein